MQSVIKSQQHSVQRLGKNINGYFGEGIDIDAVLNDCTAAARAHGWSVEEISAAPKVNLLAFLRPASRLSGIGLESSHLPNESVSSPSPPAPRMLSGLGERVGERRSFNAAPANSTAVRLSEGATESRTTHHPSVYISAGIHGDEPAGPLAIRQLLEQDHWPAGVSLSVLPCLNPTGFAVNRRENAEGIDLNRQYLQPEAQETVAHINWLKRQPKFDLCLCLHEDWEAHGFYVYELNPDGQPSLAEKIVARVAEVCPIDTSELIEGRPARVRLRRAC